MKTWLGLGRLVFVLAVMLCGLATPTLAQNSPATGQGTSAIDELALWNSIKESSDPAGFKSYIEKFPNGMFADLAHEKYLKAGGSEADLAVTAPKPAVAPTVTPSAPKEAAISAGKPKQTVKKTVTRKVVAKKAGSARKIVKNKRSKTQYTTVKAKKKLVAKRNPIRFKKKGIVIRRVKSSPVINREGGGGAGGGGGGGGSSGGGGGWG